MPEAIAPAEAARPLAPKTTMWTTAPVAAPVVKPMTSGEPRGLREIDWKAAPDAPRARPTASPAATRGRRRPRTMRESAESGEPPASASQILPALRRIVPEDRESQARTRRSARRAEARARLRASIRNRARPHDMRSSDLIFPRSSPRVRVRRRTERR